MGLQVGKTLSRVNSIQPAQNDIWFICLWSRTILLQFFKAVLLRVPIVRYAADFVLTALILFFLTMALPYLLKKIKPSDICLYMLLILLFLCHYFFYPSNRADIFDIGVPFIFIVFPYYFVGLGFNYERMYPLLYGVSCVTIFAQFFYSVVLGETMDSTTSVYVGNMTASYNLLPHVCVLFLDTDKRKPIIKITAVILGSILIIAYGSRGPIVCLASFVLLYIIFFKKQKRSFRYLLLVLCAALIIWFSLDYILDFLNTVSSALGLSTRIFSKISSNQFFVSSDRDIIRTTLYGYIADKPMVGYGLCGDRVITGTYAHHLAIELWISFGVVLGSALLLAVFLIILKGVRYSDFGREKGFILLLFCCSVIKLFLSGSFLNENLLFLLLGICVGVMRKKACECDCFKQVFHCHNAVLYSQYIRTPFVRPKIRKGYHK